jgi:hypothetical protein
MTNTCRTLSVPIDIATKVIYIGGTNSNTNASNLDVQSATVLQDYLTSLVRILDNLCKTLDKE